MKRGSGQGKVAYLPLKSSNRKYLVLQCFVTTYMWRTELDCVTTNNFHTGFIVIIVERSDMTVDLQTKNKEIEVFLKNFKHLGGV